MSSTSIPIVSRTATNIFLGMTVLAILSTAGAAVNLIGVFL